MIKIRHLTVILLLSLFSLSSAFAKSKSADELPIMNLNGEWELFLEKTPEQTFYLTDKNIPADFIVTVPNEWNKQVAQAGLSSPVTYGCYRFVCHDLIPGFRYAVHTKESPGTSCAVFVNRTLLGQAGNPYAMTAKNYTQKPNHYGPSHSKSMPLYFEFTPDNNGDAEIIFFVANYYYRKGGLWDSVYVGPAKAIWHQNIVTLIFYCIVIGSLLFTGMLNLVQFALNKNRTEYFYLGIASLAFAIRIATASYCSLDIFFPGLTAELKLKLEMIPMWVVPVAILQLIFLIYPSNNRTILFPFLREIHIRCVLFIVELALGIASVILPAWYTSRLIPPLQIMLFVFAFYILIYAAYNIAQHKRYSVYNFLSFFTIALGGIIDIIHQSSKDIISIPTLPFFILVFVIVQIVMLSAIQNDISKETISGSGDLKKLNDAYFRYVPEEFLSLIHKDSIVKTKLGDYSNIEMAIIYSTANISFDDKAPKLEERFKAFNEYLKIISPIIKKNGGHINQILNGSFIALFPESATNAVKASIEISDKAQIFNEMHSAGYNFNPKIGIHFGKMIIGTVGVEDSLHETIISETVNTASRIQEQCDCQKIIISESAEENLSEEFKTSLTLTGLEPIYVKGKEKPLKLYELNKKKNSKKEDN